jgi:cobaltochelatase CobN
VGTHGTLEFLPGKESGMSDTCFPDYLIGHLPHFYLYYSGNPAEATIAKRRTHGCLISYAGPAFKKSGLYGETAELEGLINEFTEATSLSPQKQAQLMESIIKKASAMQLKIDGDLTVDAIADELIRLKHMLMPAGLHQIGKPFSRKMSACFLKAMLGWDRGRIHALPEILRKATSRHTKAAEAHRKTTASIREEDRIDELADRLIEDYFFGDKIFYAALVRTMDTAAKSDLDATLGYGADCLARILPTDEISGLFNALDGNYVQARIGGDLIRDPEIFPTGYNLFQFDPQLVPSETAMTRGRQIAESTVRHYREHHNGAYPETVSVVLWGLETSRTRGETVCQIMAYLGVRLKSHRASIQKTFEVIPLEALGRPRIDCVTTICGFFRDMYPTLLEFLDEAFDVVTRLDEPENMNFVRKHSRQRFEELIGQTDRDTASELSRARIFGPARGQYGTGLTTMIASGNWKDEAQLASAYMTSQKHIYTRSRRGEAHEGLFKQNLKSVDLVSQVRSSVDYTFMDLDHYYEFFGGLARSVEAVRGKKPDMLVTDSSSSKIFTDEAAKAIEIGARTRLLNPKYIEEMLKHKVHGAQQISQRVENLVGLAATTGQVETWIFSRIKQTYFDAPATYQKLQKNNLYATADMMKRMIEAWQRGYWEASEAEILELKEKYMALEGEIEGVSDVSE